MPDSVTGTGTLATVSVAGLIELSVGAGSGLMRIIAAFAGAVQKAQHQSIRDGENRG